MPESIHLWAPELSGVGGIQHYSRILLEGLTRILPDARIRVLSKNDAAGAFSPRGNLVFRGTGNVPESLRTATFSLLLMEQTILHRPELAILTHLHFAPVAHALKQLAGLRYWVAAHGLEAWGAMSALMRRALAAADRILPVSEHTRGRLIQDQGLDPAKLSILPNTVRGDDFFPEPKPAYLLRRYGLDAQHKVLFTLARLDAPDRYKGHDRIIDVLGRVRSQVPNVHYILSGRGAENERIVRRVRRMGLEGQVTLTGFLPDRDLRDHYNLCDLFAMPSQGEGFGIVYLEALACGRPVLAGNKDGSGAPLLGGDLGLRVDPEDGSALAEAIMKLLLKRDVSPHLYDSGHLRRQVLEHFGFEVLRRRLGKLLHG